jgi:acyl carrier protein
MTFEKIREIIMDQVGVDEAEVTLASTFDELGVDSLGIFEIVMALEEAFEIEIPNEDAENIKTVGDAVKYVDSKTE